LTIYPQIPTFIFTHKRYDPKIRGNLYKNITLPIWTGRRFNGFPTMIEMQFDEIISLNKNNPMPYSFNCRNNILTLTDTCLAWQFTDVGVGDFAIIDFDTGLELMSGQDFLEFMYPVDMIPIEMWGANSMQMAHKIDIHEKYDDAVSGTMFDNFQKRYGEQLGGTPNIKCLHEQGLAWEHMPRNG